jgi:putative transposase
MFDHIETFNNPTHKHTNNSMLSPLDYEIKQRKLRRIGVCKSRGTSIWIHRR